MEKMIIKHLKTKIQTKITKFIELLQFRDYFLMAYIFSFKKDTAKL
jgi:hypothetical protein